MAAAAEDGGVARQAELRRAEGNACFRKARLGAAIDCYTEAIALCPRVAVYWVNRGLCHFRRKDWARVVEDSRRALALDDTSVKGHYLLGCALLEKEDCALAVKEFEKALDLLKSSNSRDKMAEVGGHLAASCQGEVPRLGKALHSASLEDAKFKGSM